MSIQAYQNAAKKTEGPRQTEYRAFAQATRGLIDASSLPTTEVGRRAEALAANRRLWSLLAADCAAEGNQLSQPLRAQIISLSMFVDRHSSQVMRAGAPIDVLIEINRTIMQGLSPSQTPSVAGLS
ncbi:MAG: flagellar biosynthesis regulator FlaF [Hyphomonadaceae bacterium]|nr:flagellar biosynthesis regulator FlaF [Hyphomonadaceae bacterium]